jgi:hypothetical protein
MDEKRQDRTLRSAAPLRLAVWFRWAVTSDAEERVPTGRRADWL